MSNPAAMKKAQAELAAKREAAAKAKEEAKLAAEAEAARRDVPPGIEETMPPTHYTPPEELTELLKNFQPVAKPPVNLYAAIHKAQAKFETVRKNGKNPHYNSKYATLDEVWETVQRAINDAGLIVFCTIESLEDGKKQLTTHVAEVKSGEEIACAFPIMAANTSPQAIGSAMTYARRYTLTALLEIVTGDGADDDGEAATNHNTTPAKNPSTSAAADALGF